MRYDWFMETDCIRSAASINAEEAHYAGIQEELDAEASELRLSVIEHLDRQHVEACAEYERIWSCYGVWMHRVVMAQRRMDALWSALEIVRNIEARV